MDTICPFQLTADTPNPGLGVSVICNSAIYIGLTSASTALWRWPGYFTSWNVMGQVAMDRLVSHPSGGTKTPACTVYTPGSTITPGIITAW